MTFHDNEATVTPPTTTNGESDEDVKHSPETTKTTVEYVHDLLKDEGDEGDFDVYDKIMTTGAAKGAMWFKVIHSETELAYRVIVEPIDD